MDTLPKVQTPRIGRKLWYWPSGEQDLTCNDPRVPFDATVVYPWGDNCVNLRVTDHAGQTVTRTSVFLHQGALEDRPTGRPVATWMPYQQKEHAKQADA